MTHHPIHELREVLQAQSLSGFIIPHEDEFLGKTVLESDDRLKFLTGFTGSAGLAIVLDDKAALFVDGRYVLQAPMQVDTALFEIVSIIETPPWRWLTENLEADARIGIDPALHSYEQYKKYLTALEESGAALISVQDNPVDEIWVNRPQSVLSDVELYPLDYAGESSAEKRRRLADILRCAQQDKMLITSAENIAWLLNIRGQDVPYTPLALSRAILSADGRLDWYIEPARIKHIAAHLSDDIFIHPPEAIIPDIKQFKNLTLRLAPESCNAHIATSIKECTIAEAVDLCELPKARKNQAEIAGMIDAHIYDAAALCKFLHWLDVNARHESISEISAAQKLESFRKAHPYLRDLSFPTIAGSGPHGAIVHYHATEETNRVLQAGDLFLCDSGGQYINGTTDVTRTVLIGGTDAPPPDDAVTMFTHVLKGHIQLAMARFPKGTDGIQLDALARAPLWQVGADFAHGTGHGVGCYLSVHEGPQRISKGGMVALQQGMVVSNEPGYYRAGAFGIRIENLQYVVAAENDMLAFEPLTLAPIDRRLIDVHILTSAELNWLNEYHQRVYETISPLLDVPQKNWLKQQTENLSF